MEFNEIWQEARSQCPIQSLCFSGRSEKQDGHPVSDWLRHFRLLLWNRLTEFNETWQEARFQCPLPRLCVFGPIEKKKPKMTAPASDWLRHFPTSPLKPLNGIQQNLTGSKISMEAGSQDLNSTKPDRKQDLPRLCFFRTDRKNGHPSLWFAETFSTSPLEQIKLDRNQDINVLYTKFVFRVDQKNKIATLTSNWLIHFRLLLWNCWIEFNETFQEARFQRLLPSWQEARYQRPLPSLCFSGWWENKMATLTSDWLRRFRLFWNCWMDFNETWQEARSQCPIPSLCFSGRWEKQDGHHCLWLAET